MQRPILLACFATSVMALSALAEPPAKPVIDGTSWVGDCDALTAPPLVVNVSDATVVYADWWEDGDTAGKVRVYLHNTGGTRWETSLPVNHVGHAYLEIVAENADGPSAPETADYVITENTTDPRGLTNQRYPDLFNWTKPNSGKQTITAGNLDNDWYGVGVVRQASLSQIVRIRGTVNDVVPAQNGQNAGGFIKTRAQVADGVGSIWFKAKMTSRNATDAGTLVVEQITYTLKNSRPVYAYNTVAELTVPLPQGVDQWHQFHLILQANPATAENRAYYRIRNATLVRTDNDRFTIGSIDLCDLVLSPILPDVVVTKDEADYAPGYPSLQDPIEFHIAVSNRYEGATAANFTPMLVWRQSDADPWQTTPMTNRADRTDTGDGVYACALNAGEVDAGPFEYFYRVNFTGYTPTFPTVKYYQHKSLNNVVNDRFTWGQHDYDYLIDANDLALLTYPTEVVRTNLSTGLPEQATDTIGLVSECRSPAYKPDFADEFGFLQYATSLDVVPGTPAADGTWDFTRKFDLSDLDENYGWSHADAWFGTRLDGRAVVQTGPVDMQAPFSYLTFLAEDGIRRFRSAYTHVAAVPRPWNAENPGFDIDAGPVPGLDDSYEMQLVGDYTWQAILRQTNAIDAAFAVTGAWHSATNTTEYGHGSTNGTPDSPFFWLENDQVATAINPPSQGRVARYDSVETAHERWVTNLVETLVTNLTTETVSGSRPLATVRPAGLSADLPVAYANAGAQTNWHDIAAAWFRATSESSASNLVEIVSYDDGTNYWSFITQVAALTVTYDEEDDRELVETNWPAAWSPQILDGGAVTNLWPAEIPAGWLTVNWAETTKAGDVFPSFEASALVTNGCNLERFSWSTNFTDFVTVDVAGAAEAGAPIAALSVEQRSRDGLPWTVSTSGSWISDAALGTTNVPVRTKETYYTYRPVAEPDSPDRWLGTRVQIDYDGFLMYRFCTTNREFQVRRAAWQDFNDWAADINWFSRSYGLYGMKTFTCDLDGRGVTLFDSMPAAGFEEWTGFVADHRRLVSEYWDGFFADNAWGIDERPRRSGSSKNNKAVRLMPWRRGGEDQNGTLETTKGTYTEGRGDWTMKVRSSADDRITATYKYGFDWTDYFLAVQIEVSDVSPAQGAYASVLVRYDDPENFVEARLSQKGEYRKVGTTEQLCQWLELEVFQVLDGMTNRLDTRNASLAKKEDWAGVNGGSNNNRYYLRWPTNRNNDNNKTTGEIGDKFTLRKNWTLGLAVEGDTIEAYLWDNTMTKDAAKPTVVKPVYYQLPDYNATSGKLVSGTFGFDVYDVAATFRPWAFPIEEKPEGENNKATSAVSWQLRQTSAAEFRNVCYDNSTTSYQQNTESAVDRVKPWTVKGAGENKAVGITRGVPTAYYRVRTYRMGVEKSNQQLAPGKTANTDWSDRWDEVNGHQYDQVRPVTSYDWQPVEIPMKLWDDTFVQIQALSWDAVSGNTKEFNLGAPVVDEFRCNAWLGHEEHDPLLTGNNATNRMAVESWTGTYSAIVSNGVALLDRKWELARSRANPERLQTVTTPLMEHGVGDIIFSYQADVGKVSFVAELVDEEDNSAQPIEFWTAAPGEDPKPGYAAALVLTTGRLRVRTLGTNETVRMTTGQTHTSETDVSGVLFLDNFIAHDYPNDADSAWEAYNLLISSFITTDAGNDHGTGHSTLACQKELKFDGKASQYDSCRSAVLNDGTTAETLQDSVYDEHKPFLQTPSIATGIGEISFWYRAAPGNTDNASVKLMAARTGSTPDDMWVELTADDLNPNTGRSEREQASMEALADIPPDTPWTYFSAEFYQGEFKMLRLVADTNAQGRVLVDNVLITEPVRTSIDVGTVEFLPGVPLCTTNTGAKVTLVNPRKNPTEFEVYIDWYATKGALEEVDIPTRSFEYETVPHKHPVKVTVNGVEYDAEYTTYDHVVHTNDLVSRTVLPADLKWGYENWPARERARDKSGRDYWIRGSGTIGLATNETDGPYTFWSTNSIPTTEYPPDTVFQYCVRVDYKGEFSKPILSETQSRTRNGFWFENPSWYDPIDLNAYRQTEDRPVAHFWNFTVSTNQAFVNEIKLIQYSSTGEGWWATTGFDVDTNSIERQFVELIGRHGGDLSGWKIEHAGTDATTGSLSPWAAPAWTNSLKKGAAFGEPDPAAATNKGWGVYVVGGRNLPGGRAAGEALFSDEANAALAAETDTENYKNHVFLRAPYGLTLKRGMGAYVDRICWGENNAQRDVQDLMDAGFRYIGYRLHSTLGSSGETLSWRGTQSKADQSDSDWDSQTSPSAAGFNPGQEDRLWPLSYEEELPDPPLIAQPVIRDFGWTNGVATVTFDVWVTNGVELTAADYVWRCQYSDDLATLDEGTVYRFEGVSAPADGTPNRVVVEVEFPNPPDTNFFRLIATPTGEYH